MDVPLSIWSMAAIKWQLNTDRPDKERAGLVSHWARRINVTLFEPVLAQCERLKYIRYVWWGCCFKRFIRPDGAVRGWEDSLCSGRLFHYCAHVFEFYKANCSAVEIHSFSGSTWQFLTVNSTKVSFGLSWHLDWIILDTAVHSYSFSLSSHRVVAAVILWHTLTISLCMQGPSIRLLQEEFTLGNRISLNPSTCQRIT